MKRPRLSQAEIDILLGIIGFVEAGEASGGPLDGGDADKEKSPKTARRYRLMYSARRKLSDMFAMREEAKERRKKNVRR